VEPVLRSTRLLSRPADGPLVFADRLCDGGLRDVLLGREWRLIAGVKH
jgi:hypothetical protein